MQLAPKRVRGAQDVPVAAAQPESVPLGRRRRRTASAFRSSDHGLLLLALLVGAGAGGGAIVFRWLITSFTRLLSGYADYSIVGPAANPHLPALGRWFVIGAPVVAGLVYGPLVHFFAREARGHGVPEVMYAVARRGGRIPPQVAAVKALASALCIGGGGSVGREGPIVQIGSALGSTVARVTGAAESRTRILVACGAAGGIAATFNAPLAGVFFAMELILRDFTARSFGMVVLASVMASVIGRDAFGTTPFLHLPAFTVQHPVEYFLFAVLGVVAGAVGVLFTRVLYWIEDACDFLWRWPEWLRPAAGGVLLGLLLLALPEMYGVGYPVLERGVNGGYVLLFLLTLMLGKILATSLTIGIGGSGGVFAPSLFIGAMFGAFFGTVVHHALPGVAGPLGAYGLIGMGAVFAGAARAPITAVVIMFELTGDYSIILPLMAAIVLATGVSNLLSNDTIYTLKLRRRGIDLDERANARALTVIRVGEAMQAITVTVPGDVGLAAAATMVDNEPLGLAAVVDRDGTYSGVLTAQALADSLADGEHDDALAASIADPMVAVATDDTLDDALDVLDNAHGPGVPVIDGQTGGVVGWLTHSDVLRAMRPSRKVVTGSAPRG